MSDIAPIGPPTAASATLTGRSAPASVPTSDSTTTRGSDKVELSTAAQFLSKLAQLPDVRQDLVDNIKSQIASGTYETPEKIDVAITNLNQDIQGN